MSAACCVFAGLLYVAGGRSQVNQVVAAVEVCRQLGTEWFAPDGINSSSPSSPATGIDCLKCNSNGC